MHHKRSKIGNGEIYGFSRTIISKVDHLLTKPSLKDNFCLTCIKMQDNLLKNDSCQRFTPLIHQPIEMLRSIMSLWSFMQ